MLFPKFNIGDVVLSQSGYGDHLYGSCLLIRIDKRNFRRAPNDTLPHWYYGGEAILLTLNKERGLFEPVRDPDIVYRYDSQKERDLEPLNGKKVNLQALTGMNFSIN